MIGRNIKKIITYFLSITLFFLIWSMLAKSVNAPLILPTVSEVFKKIGELVIQPIFWKNFFCTFIRVIIGFIISFSVGTILGILCGYSRTLKDFLDFPLSFIRSTPVIAIILITLLWFNSSKLPIFVSILMGLPIVVSSVTQGMKQNTKNLLFMSEVYNFTNFEKFKYIKLKELKPFLINSAVSVFGLTWKVVVAGEVLSIPKYGFGTLMQLNQVHLETATVMAITLILVITSFVLEKAFSFILKSGNFIKKV